MKKFSRKIKNIRKKKLKSINIRSYIWASFIVFTLCILGLLWFFQYIMLSTYYSKMKADQLVKVSESISTQTNYKNEQELKSAVRNEAFKNSISIVVTDENGNVEIHENMLGSSSMFQADIVKDYGTFIYSLKSDYENYGYEIMTKSFKNDSFGSKGLFVVTSFNFQGEKKYLLIESSLEMMDSTTKIIKTQLLYITIILFELTFIISLFISNALSKPIIKITKTAKKFAEGDYNAKFEKSGYLEVQELASVLDQARTEVSKVTDLRKDLIANVSHDLRTPLTIIKSYAEMIRDLSGDNPQKRQEHLQVIIDESDRLSALVSSLLELSKLESETIELSPSEFSISEKLDEVMQRYILLVENDGYDISFEKAEDRICVADIAKIEQVFYNLINNAVNYCGEGKKIIVRQINLEKFVRIEVIDDGEGIPKENLPLIFDRYYRSERHKRDKAGTGLGLSIVKEILKKHEFPFGVMSEQGKGSTFWFEIAVKDADNKKTK